MESSAAPVRCCHPASVALTLFLASAAYAGKGWVFAEVESSETRTPALLLTRAAESGANQFGKSPVLALRCSRGILDVYIDWKTYINDGPRQVVDQVDDGPRVALNWNVSTNFESTFRPGAEGLVRQLLGAKRYRASTDPYSQEVIRAVFDLRGLDKAIRQFDDQCPY